MYFPTICVDNFFNNPDEVRRYALSLNYHSEKTGVWPGKRTECLSKININFYTVFFQKFFSLSYDKKETLNAEMRLHFALMTKEETDHIETGWIHTDTHAKYAGLVYLNPTISLESGTSIYKKKNNYYSDGATAYIKSRLYLGSKTNEDANGLKEHNSNYEETIRFSNIYNRLIAFDSKQYHGINSFSSEENNPRLTVLFFIYNLRASRFPIPESKTYEI